VRFLSSIAHFAFFTIDGGTQRLALFRQAVNETFVPCVSFVFVWSENNDTPAGRRRPDRRKVMDANQAICAVSR